MINQMRCKAFETLIKIIFMSLCATMYAPLFDILYLLLLSLAMTTEPPLDIHI